MFDSNHYRGPEISVNIKQQPNDAADSARLYGELKRKAEEEVSQATIQKFGAYNEVEVISADTWEDYNTQKKHYRLLFKINGNTYDIQTEAYPDELAHNTAYEVNRALLAEVFDKCLSKLVSYRR